MFWVGSQFSMPFVDAVVGAVAAGADDVVELDVTGCIDDAATLVVDELAVVVEAHVAVDEDRAEDLHDVRDVVPGDLAQEVVPRVLVLAGVTRVRQA